MSSSKIREAPTSPSAAGRGVVTHRVVPDPNGGKPYVWRVDAYGTGWTCDCPQCGLRASVARSARRPMYVRCLGERDVGRCGHWIPTP